LSFFLSLIISDNIFLLLIYRRKKMSQSSSTSLPNNASSPSTLSPSTSLPRVILETPNSKYDVISSSSTSSNPLPPGSGNHATIILPETPITPVLTQEVVPGTLPTTKQRPTQQQQQHRIGVSPLQLFPYQGGGSRHKYAFVSKRRKLKSRSKSKSKSKRKSNKNRMQRKKSHRRSRYY
jgi:hypothetical protein